MQRDHIRTRQKHGRDQQHRRRADDPGEPRQYEVRQRRPTEQQDDHSQAIFTGRCHNPGRTEVRHDSDTGEAKGKA